MQKRCRAFPSENQHEFTKKRLQKTEPYRPVEHWEDEDPAPAATNKLGKKSEDLIKKLILERYVSSYGLDFKDRSEEQRNSEEKDLGNELISYLKQLYYTPHKKKVTRLPYTSTRLFGYASPQNLRPPLSDYQDTYGRTGGRVMLRNIQKIIASKRRQKIQTKLLANLIPDREFSGHQDSEKMLFEAEDEVRDFATVYRKEYGPKRIKNIFKATLFTPEKSTDSDVITEAYTNHLRTKNENDNLPYRKRSENAEDYLKKIRDEHPRLQKFFSRDPPDEAVIEREKQKLIKSVYQEEYCNESEEEEDSNRIVLPDDYPISETIQRKSYRDPKSLGANASLRTKVTKPPNNLGFNQKEREILQMRTGSSEYQDHIDKVGERIMVDEFYGPPMPSDLSAEQIEEMTRQESICSGILMDTSKDHIISQIF